MNKLTLAGLAALVCLSWGCASNGKTPSEAGSVIVDGAVAGGDAGPDTADAAGTVAPFVTCGDRALFRAPGRLLNTYVLATGFAVVTADIVTLFARDGHVIKTVADSREIMTSTWDGERLVVADRTLATIYDATLTAKSTFQLGATCTTAVAIDWTRWVCGLAVQPNIRVYDLSTGKQLQMDGVNGAADLKLIEIPGRPVFSADSSVYRLDDMNKTVRVTSLEVNDYPVAFLGRPATQMIERSGAILRLFGPACTTPDVPDKRCFMKEGMTGTLRARETVVAMTDDGVRPYLAIRTDKSESPQDTPCADNCTLQQLDVENRRISREVKYTRPNARIISLAHDAVCRKLLVGYRYAPTNAVEFGVDVVGYDDTPATTSDAGVPDTSAADGQPIDTSF